ncbi:MAG: c-type cytochrome [Planctomycetaceae bacterium]|nr:c-type cytochrome [Planctomycetaceae bacterium]
MRAQHLVFLFVLSLVACSETAKEPQTPNPTPLATPAAPTDPAPVADASALYRQAVCVGCHGPKLEGGVLGPVLTGLSAHWNREDLARFFADPESFVASVPRIAEQKAKYSMPMPPAAGLSEAERLALADWLLQH